MKWSTQLFKAQRLLVRLSTIRFNIRKVLRSAHIVYICVSLCVSEKKTEIISQNSIN